VTSSATTIAQIIDQRPLSALQIRVFVLCALVVFIDGYDLQAMGLALPALSQTWGVPPSSFGWALAASLVGVGVGSAFVAPLGDRWGRRPLLLLGVVVIGCSSLGTTLSANMQHLIMWRLLTGIGLGVCQSNATALTAEYAPLQSRATIMTIMGCNIALGALVAGFTAPWVIERGGWQGLFVVGGVLPLALFLALLVGVPESVRLLISRGIKDARIAKVLRAMAPDVDPTAVEPDRREVVQSDSFMDLVRPPYFERTWRLWLIFAGNALLLYTLVSWLPTLLGEAGWSQADALRGVVAQQVGGIVGALALSWCVDRGHTVAALIYSYSITGIVALLFAVVPPTGPAWWFMLAVLGAGISGGMFTIIALGAIFYPPVLRATGFGWAAAMARIGAVLGPLLAGWILAWGLPSAKIMGMLAGPVLICALAAWSLKSVLRRIQQDEIQAAAKAVA
jgi:MFS transporter, AAHS family, 4-hydroxybenzoate transporter